MTLHTNGTRPTCYDNHPPESMTARPLMMLADHQKQQNEFACFHHESFITKLMFGLILAWALLFSLYTFFSTQGQGFDAYLLLIGVSLTVLSSAFLHHIRTTPIEIAGRPLKNQNDLDWVVFRKWAPLKLAWHFAAATFGLNGWVLSMAGLFVSPVTILMAMGVFILVLAALPVFGFSHLESKALLYIDESSIERWQKIRRS